MSSIPSISSSISTALLGGFAQLDKGASEIADATSGDSAPEVATDTATFRSGSIISSEPLLAGVRDLMLAKIQVGAGAALLRVYSQNRQDLFDMLKP